MERKALALLILGIFLATTISIQAASARFFSVMSEGGGGGSVFSVTILSPSPGQQFNQNDPVLIRAQIWSTRPLTSIIASITPPDLTLQQVTLVPMGVGIYQATFSSTSLAGNYNIEVVASDGLSQRSRSVGIAVVDTAPPVLTSVSPQNQTYSFLDQTSGSLDYILSASETLAGANYSVDGVAPASLTFNPASGKWESPAGSHPPLARGSHYIEYTAQDLAGNPSEIYVYFTVFLEATAANCTDASNKLNGVYDKVTLTQNVSNWPGTCITFVADNVVFDGGKGQGVYIDGAGSGWGIDTNGRSGVTVQNAEVKEFAEGVGPSNGGGNNNYILNNRVHHNLDVGIIWWDGNNWRVEGNLIEWNSRDGIGGGPTSNNNIIGNTIRLNRRDGLNLFQFSNTLIINNNIQENGVATGDYGLSVWWNSNGNTIYHNNLISNFAQARDNGNNLWDNGPVSGGNYWSDHTCIPSGGGICSNPYVIPTSGQDNYPLQSIWTG